MPSRSLRINDVLKQTKSTTSSIKKPRSKPKNQVVVKHEAQEALVLAPQATNTIGEAPDVDVKRPVPPTQPNLQDAMSHLCSVDPRFHELFQRFVPQPWTHTGLAQPKNHFRSLVLGILSQQVSGAAARSIGRKFVNLFASTVQDEHTSMVDMDPEVEDGTVQSRVTIPVQEQASTSTFSSAAPANETLVASFFPTPDQVAASEILRLKSAGLSLRKAEYVHGVAQAFVARDLTDEFFANADDETINKKLTSIRGLGPWSAEMFMVGLQSTNL